MGDAPKIPRTSDPPAKRCAICGRPRDPKYDPFCSRRCADVDLNRWLSGVYAVPVTEDEEEDEMRDDGNPPVQ